MNVSAPPEPGRFRRIQDAYPRYSQRLLDVMFEDYLETANEYLIATGRGHYDLTRSFASEPLQASDGQRIKDNKVIAMSLYFKAADFHKRQSHPAIDASGNIEMGELERRDHPLWKNGPRYGHNFFENYLNKVLTADFGEWIPVVFLAKDLSMLEPMLREKGWVVVKMQHSSLAECPGVMWRYLCFNLNSECCYIQDTDRDFDLHRIEGLYRLLQQQPKVALMRPLQYTSGMGEMALILGNDFMVRPRNIDFDVARMMLGYITLNVLHEDRLNNFVHEPTRGRDDCAVEPMSKRLLREYIGPHPHERAVHKNYPYYPFDEQWLREFVYYHLSDGRMATLLGNNERKDDTIQRLDLEHQRGRGNVVLSRADEAALLAAQSG